MSLRQDDASQYGAWKKATWFNERHMEFAWASLIWVMVTDVYVRLVLDGRHHRPQHLGLVSHGSTSPRSRPSSTTCW